MLLGQRIQKVRSESGLTQDEFSKKIEVSKRTLIDYEKSESEPKASTLVKICDIFNVSISWLLTEDGNMMAQNENIDIPKTTKILFFEAIKISEFNPYGLDEILIEYILSNSLHKIKEIKRSEGFWNRFLLNRWQTIGYLRILTRSISEAKETYKNEIFTVDNSKKILKLIISTYQLRLIKDKINNAINEKTRKELLDWIDEELDDIACFVMLSDFDMAILAIKKTLDKVDQLTVKLD